jgi:diguanylate cyclase (GGDEF)-like protein
MTPRGWKHLLIFAVPIVGLLLLASLCLATLTLDLLAQVSTGANIKDRERTEQIVGSALTAIKQQLANTAIDNAYWDDAFRSLNARLDMGWIKETYGFATESGVNYDALLVVDRDSPKAVAGLRKGQPFMPATDNYFSGKLDQLLEPLPKDLTPKSKASILNTADGLAVTAAAPIVPTSQDLKIPEKPRYLVMLKFLTPEYLETVGNQYVIRDLRMTTVAAERSNGVVITDLLGAPVATVQWTDRRPGDVARAAVAKKATIVLSFLAAVMLGIGAVCLWLIRNIVLREATARHDALHDPLTGLPNRAALSAAINSLVAGGETIAVTFADLDGFKEVNDTYDHETGDRLICEAAASITALAKGKGIAYRLGGDEFVVLFRASDAQEQACHFAKEFITLLSKPFDLDGKIGSVGASIGIAVARGPINAQELMRRADIAMYKAKSGGKNRYCLFSSKFDAERNEILDISGELRRIIADGSIEIAYQPIVDSHKATIVGVEALARWPSSSSRQVTPDRFIRVAETCGLIDDLGNAILAKACVQANQWPAIRLAINISPVQLRNPEFVSRTLQTIAESSTDPCRVELEITEGTFLDDVNDAKSIVAELRAAGVSIVLDDFGSGVSSIGYLRQLDFDRIKIDRALVEQVLRGSAEQKIVQGTVLMAAGLTARVTAEGVEKEEQAVLMRLAGCTELQGYYFFKPLSAENIFRLLSAPPAVMSVTPT